MSQPELAQQAAKEMTISTFAALASQSGSPYVEAVDEPYAAVTGDPPDGTTAHMKQDIAAALASEVVQLSKGRIYVDDPSEVPEGYEPQEGPQGGIYYEVEGSSGVGGDGDPPSDGGGNGGGGGAADPGDDDDGDATATMPDPDTDIPRFRDSEQAAELIETTNTENGEGFTLKRNLEPENVFDKDMYLVGVTSINFEGDDAEIDKDDVIDWYTQWQDLLQDEPAIRIGGFNFPEDEKISIDLSVGVEDKDEAVKLGQRANQHSVANLYRGDFPETGGDGVSPFETTEDIKRALSDIDTLKKTLLRWWTATMTKANTNSPDPDAMYEGTESGRVLPYRKIGLLGWKTATNVERTDDGYLVGGELFVPVEGSDGDREA